RVHELLARLLRRRPGAGRDPGERGDLRLWGARQAWRELHAVDGGFGRRYGRDGRAYPDDALARPGRAADLAAHRVLPVHRHARGRAGHALHAARRRPHAAQVPIGARGRQHPARALRPGGAAPHDPWRKVGFLISLGTILGAAIVDITLVVREALARHGSTAPVEPAATEEWKRVDTRKLLAWVVFWGIAVVIVSASLGVPAGYA